MLDPILYKEEEGRDVVSSDEGGHQERAAPRQEEERLPRCKAQHKRIAMEVEGEGACTEKGIF